MATKDSKKNDFDLEEEAAPAPAKAQSPAPAPAPAAPAAPEPVVSFDRWFASLGRPQHHKAGMKAYASTKGKKTVTAWIAVFAGY